MRGVAIFAFGAGLFFLSMALMTKILSSMATRRHAAEPFEIVFLTLLTYCLVGMALTSFMFSLRLVRS